VIVEKPFGRDLASAAALDRLLPRFEFLARAFRELLINFTWWVNRKDALGRNVFEGGFPGLDNIGPFDRSGLLPGGAVLEQRAGRIAHRAVRPRLEPARTAVRSAATARCSRATPAWQEPLLFQEYFNGDTGEGPGASHRTGWTVLAGGLIADRRRRGPGGRAPAHLAAGRRTPEVVTPPPPWAQAAPTAAAAVANFVTSKG
jgi:hypothetical protein